PKHLYLYKWLGYEVPQFAHLPLLLNDDRSKMSKRKGDVAAEAYRAKGYLPEAMVNFLALLGWNPGDDTELMTLETLIQRFSIERITKAGAVFDREKLNWMNQHYLAHVPIDRLYPLLQPYIAQTPYAGQDEAMLRKICVAVQPALVTLPDIGKHLALFFRPDGEPVPADVREVIGVDTAQTVFRALREKVAQAPSLTAESFTELVKAVQKDTQVKGKLLWGPLRAALTLATEGPDLKLVVDVLGKDKILARLDQALSERAA
ncbi:MAG TPA: glutamate--tRNA ligase family protein, partial [bacterium]